MSIHGYRLRHWKKFISVITLFFFALTPFGPAVQIAFGAEGDPIVIVGSDSGLPGDVISIPITIDELNDMASYGLDLKYDPNALEPISITNGNIINGLFVPNLAADTDTVSVANTQFLGATSGDKLCSVEFKILDTAIPGTSTDLTLTRVNIAGVSQTISVESVNGKVNVISYSPIVSSIQVATAFQGIIDYDFGTVSGYKTSEDTIPVEVTIQFIDGTVEGEVKAASSPDADWPSLENWAAWGTSLSLVDGKYVGEVSLPADSELGIPEIVVAAMATIDQETYLGVSGTTPLYVYRDTQAPAGSITINDGAQTAYSTNVKLQVVSNDSDLEKVEVSNDQTSWEEVTSTGLVDWTLIQGADGERTVYVRLIDDVGNSEVISDTINLSTDIAVVETNLTPGTYYDLSEKSVTLSNGGQGSIYFTTGGTDPVNTQGQIIGTLYSVPIKFTDDITIKAVTVVGDPEIVGSIATFEYKFGQFGSIYAIPDEGQYSVATKQIELSVDPTSPDTAIEYHLGNSVWTDYTNPFNVQIPGTVYARLVSELDGTPSETQEFVYTLDTTYHSVVNALDTLKKMANRLTDAQFLFLVQQVDNLDTMNDFEAGEMDDLAVVLNNYWVTNIGTFRTKVLAEDTAYLVTFFKAIREAIPERIIGPLRDDLQIGQDTIILVGLDVIGSGLNLLEVTQELKDAVNNILDNHGILDYKADIAALGFKFVNWQAYLGEMSDSDRIVLKDIMKEMAPSEIKSVEISGPTVIEVTSDGSVSVQYTAAVKDQYGDTMSGEGIQWSIEGNSAVTVSGSGLVSAGSSAIGTDFTITATSVSENSVFSTLFVEVIETPSSIATAAVVKAEGSKSQDDVDAARILVNVLPDSLGRTALINRLDTVQDQIDKASAIKDAIAAIDALPTTINLTHETTVIAARNLVNTAITKGATGADITNIAKLVDAEAVIQVLKAAAGVTSIQNPVQDAKTLTLPISSGYLVTIKSSSKLSVVAIDGKITPPVADTTVNIVLTLINLNTGKSADTVSITITVPQSKAAKDAAEQAVVNQVAAGVTSIATQAKDATALTLPVVSGYSVAIKSSNNTGLIATNGSITPPNAATTVGIVLTLTSTTTGKFADTALITVVVPQSSQGEALATATLKVQAAEALIADLSTEAKIDVAQSAKNQADVAVSALADSSSKTALLTRLAAVQTAINNATMVLNSPNRMGITGARLVEVNKAVQYTASVFNKAGNKMNVDSSQITWSSSNLSVATVSSTGLVTGVALGNALIIAQYGTLSITAAVEVFQIPDLVVTGVINGATVNRDVTITAYCEGKDITIGGEVPVNGIAQKTYTTDGNYSVTVFVEELSKSETLNFTIDTTAPTVTITNYATVENDPAGVTPLVDFDGDYVATTGVIQLNGNLYDRTPITHPGSYTLTASVQDAAGNTGYDSKTFEVRWDAETPVITISGVADGQIYASASPVITLAGGNNQSTYTYTADLTKPDGTSAQYTTGQTIPALTAPGRYRLAVNAVNPSYINFTSGKLIEFSVDSAAPVVTIGGVPDLSKTAVTPLITMSDDVASEAVLTQKAVATLTRNGHNAQYNLRDTIKNDGFYELNVTTTDGFGRISVPAIKSFTIDTTAPAISLSGVINGSTYKDRNVTITAATNEGTLTVTSNGSAITLNGSNQYTFTGNNSQVTLYTLVLTATDVAGNTTERKVNFTIDRLPVNIVITGVDDGKVTNQNPNINFITYEGTAVGTGSTSATINGASFPGGVLSQEGTHKLVVTYQTNGNPYIKELNFIVDKTAPVVSLVGVQKNGGDATGNIYVKSGDTLKVKAAVTEAVAIKEVFFSVGSVKVTMEKQQDGSYEGIWTVGSGSHSNITLTVFAKDTAGNAGKIDRTGKVHIDNNKPTVARFTNPAQPGGINGIFTAANMTVILTGETGETINYNLNGTEGSETATVTLNPAQGSNVITYYAVDQAGNSSDQSTYRFEYDSIPPTDVTLTSLASELTSTARFTVTGQVTGERSNGTKVVMRKAEEVVGTANVETGGTFVITGVILKEGLNTFTLRAIDAAGNTSANPVTLTRNLDTTQPVLTVNKVNETNYSVSVNEQVTEVSASFNGTPIDMVNISGPNSGVYNVITPTPVSGSNYLKVTAKDFAGNGSSGGSFTSTYIPPATEQKNLPIAGNATMDIPSGAFTGTTQLTVKSGAPVQGLMLKGLGAPISFSFSEIPTQPVTVRININSGLRGVALFHITDEGKQEPIPMIVVEDSTTFNENAMLEDTGYYLKDTGYIIIKTVKFSEYQAAFDDAAPEITISTTDYEISLGDTPKIEGTIADTDPMVYVSEVLVNGVAMNLTGKDIDNNFSIVLTLAQGTNEVRLKAEDAAGNFSGITRTYVVDTVAPVLQASKAADLTSADSVNLTITVDESSEVFVNNISQGTVQGTKNITVSLNEGSNSFNIVAKDALGNLSNTVTLSVVRDSIAPEIDIDGVSEADVYGSARTITVTANEGLTPEVTIDGVAFVSGSFSTEGQHTLVATATDVAGNSTTVTVTFTIDTKVPEIIIGGVSGGGTYPEDKGVTMNAPGATNLTVTKSVDGGVPENVAVIGTSADIAFNVPAGEVHTFTIQVTATKMVDSEVRIATSTFTFTIDKKAPIITIGGVSDGETYTSARTITVTANEGLTPQVTIDGVAFVSGSIFSTLGDHTLVATATDTAGNLTNVTITFTITAPTGGGGGGAPAPTTPVLDNNEVTKQLNQGKDEVTFTLAKGSTEVEITADAISKLNAAGKDLVINTDNGTFRIPAGTFDGMVTLEITKVSNVNADALTESLSSEYTAVGNVFEITAIPAPKKSIQVTLSYAGIEISGIDTDTLGVYWYNERTKEWEYVGGVVDKGAMTITFTADHFSKYTIMAHAKTFADIAGHWAKADIELMVSKGIINGMSETEFAPNIDITRAQFAALLVRALGLTIDTSAQLSFSDVAGSKWYYGEIAAAFKAGIVKGMTLTEFAPDANITREQMAVMVTRALAYAGITADLSADQVNTKLAKFIDVNDIALWAKPDVAKAMELGIISGRTADTFVAKANATRAESAVMIKRMYEQLH